MKTIHMTIEPHLLKAVDKLTRRRKTRRSALIRTALVTELRRERINVSTREVGLGDCAEKR
jgi:metal-responsive CopG/Arc/MetJ family transcriptional regulator